VRLSEHVIARPDNGVGCEENLVWLKGPMGVEGCLCLQARETLYEMHGRFLGESCLVDIGWFYAELESSTFQQLFATR
jgi:hypothetical protein